jgi:hypothetical protein
LTKNINMNIKETFLALTSRTYPYGYEEELISFLPKGYQTDDDGNYLYKIGSSKTIFASHLDTACKEQVGVIHKFDGKMIRTNGKSILGADDKAGVTILLYLIEKKIPGTYYFFIGEEVGCIGSGLAAKRTEIFKQYDRIISFDRRGTTSVITHQSGKRSCSDDFAKALAKELNRYGLSYQTDSTGVYTDSAEFVSVIPECTNLSVGYYKEHTHEEHQDIDHLVLLCSAAARVDWESLPTKRDPAKVEWDDDSYYGWGSFNKKSTKKSSSYDRDDYGYGWASDSRSRSTGFDRNWNNRSHKKSQAYYEDLDRPMVKRGKNYEFVTTTSPIIDEDFPAIKNEIRNRGAYYDSLKRVIFDDKLTKDEFITIKDQYLDMSDPEDRKFASYIESVL